MTIRHLPALLESVRADTIRRSLPQVSPQVFELADALVERRLAALQMVGTDGLTDRERDARFRAAVDRAEHFENLTKERLMASFPKAGETM